MKTNTMNNTIVDRFFNSIVKPSDFKFKWAIVRWKNTNFDKIYAELHQLGMIDDYYKIIDGKIRLNSKRANEIFAKYKELEVKYASKHYTYLLKRKCNVVDSICKKLATLGKRDYANIQKTDNYLIIQKKSRFEQKKNRKFSCLSSMQKWVDKHNVGIDVYKLWKSTDSKTNK